MAQVQVGGGGEEEQEGVPQEVGGHQWVWALLTGQVPLQQGEFKVPFFPSPGQGKKAAKFRKKRLKLYPEGGFPGGSVVKNPPANARDMNSIPGLGSSHMPRNN